MRLTLLPADPSDAPVLAALHTAVADDLTARYGKGPWSLRTTEKGVLFQMRNGTVYALRRRGKIVATLWLCSKKPWAIDPTYFTACAKPLYLVGMAVAPAHQRKGIGRRCLEQARQIGTTWPADAIRLDAFDAEAGAVGFYARCGFEARGRKEYRGTPLVYFEMLL